MWLAFNQLRTFYISILMKIKHTHFHHLYLLSFLPTEKVALKRVFILLKALVNLTTVGD